MAMGLSRRLAILAAGMAIALVLVVTEVSLSLSERSRLEDFRLEAMAVASTLADYLNRAAPAGDPAALEAALATWAGLHLRQTSATVYVRDRSGRLALAGTTDSLTPARLAPEDERAFAGDQEVVWQEVSVRPAWHVAEPLGSRKHPTGVLSLRISTARLHEWARDERRRSYLLASIAAIVLGAGIGWLTSRWVGTPLRALDGAMVAAYAGASSGPPAPELGPDEFRTLARRYNELRDALSRRERESDARAALLALEERARGLERVALVDEASTSFAHEIGTPLNTLNGHFQLLHEDLDAHGAPDAARRVGLVLGQLERVSGIVRAWLARGAWPHPSVGPVDLRQVAGRMLEFMEPSLAATGVTASIEGAEEPPVVARCDPGLVEQILLNLLKNAVEALPRGGRITLATGTSGDTCWLTVADDGPGMREEVKQQLFNPFATTKGPLGSGLGLTVSRRLARSLDGDLTHQQSATGTCWRLTLPCAGPP
ncbi:MAG TPA: ATP-binding protein [Gemmatimonadales bacterium]|nr:ATP-binding protein [Gemmatimonadales bacterium]